MTDVCKKGTCGRILSQMPFYYFSSAISAENASATAAEAVAAEKTFAAPAVAEGGPVSIQQDVNIDDFCKAHNVSKDELIRLNSAITESTVSLKKGDVIILP